MAIEDDLKTAELEAKQLEIEKLRRDLGRKRVLDVSRAAVFVTIIGSISAIAFQAIGLLNSYFEWKTTQDQSSKYFEFKGIELFVKEQDHLLTCDENENQRKLALFGALFPYRFLSAVDDVKIYKTQQCIAAAQNLAAKSAKESGKTPTQIQAESDKARYQTAESQSPLSQPTSPDVKTRVFIQINSEDDRGAATALQTLLIGQGYVAPGIEKVSTAPDNFQVRYYYDEQKTQAEQIKALASGFVNGASVETTGPLSRTYKSLPKNTVEFWFPRKIT